MRFVQISDTHLSQDKPHFSDNWALLEAGIADQHPDLVIHTGDVTFDGAGVEVDLSYAARLMDELIRWRGGTRHHDEVDAVAFCPPHHSVEDRGRRAEIGIGELVPTNPDTSPSWGTTLPRAEEGRSQ